MFDAGTLLRFRLLKTQRRDRGFARKPGAQCQWEIVNDPACEQGSYCADIQPTKQLMGLQPLFRLFARTYYRFALRQIDPLHPDVPYIVRRLSELGAD